MSASLSQGRRVGGAGKTPEDAGEPHLQKADEGVQEHSVCSYGAHFSAEFPPIPLPYNVAPQISRMCVSL